MYLNELQNFLYRRITNPDATNESLGDERGPAPRVLEALVHGDQRLSAAERVEIYANAYFYRLLKCLGEDFPATLAVLGEDNFAALVKEYLREHPQRSHPYFTRVSTWRTFSTIIRLPNVGRSSPTSLGSKGQFSMSFMPRMPPHSVSKLCMRFLQRTGLRLSCERIRRSKSYTVNGE
jgi:hypothetical protein